MLKKIILGLIIIFSPLFAYAEIISIKESSAFIREQPDDNGPILYRAKKFTPFKLISPFKTWFLVENFEGIQGWVLGSDVSKNPTIIIKKEKAVVRTGGGENFESKWVVKKGMPFKILLKDKEWYQIISSDDKNTGWVNANDVWGYGVTNDR